MALANASDEVVRLPGQLAVAVCDAPGRVRPPADGDAAVVDLDIGMVVLGLGQIGQAVDEGDRLGEARQLHLADERIVDLAPVLGHRHTSEYDAHNDRPPRPVCGQMQTAFASPHAPLLARSRKRRPGREFLCEYVFRPLANLVVLALLPLRIAPPAVVLSATAVGLLAATELARGQLVVAAVLLQLKTILDNADGQLARASGRVSALGRYLDSLSDLVVDAALFAAIGYVTGRPFLALAGFVVLTAVLSFDYNLDRLYRAVSGDASTPPTDSGRATAVSARLYAIAYGWHDTLIERLTTWRAGGDAAMRRRYHDRTTLDVLANFGLSTQLAVLGILLAAGRPSVYCWVVLGCGLALVPLALRREMLARRRPAVPTPVRVMP